MQALRKLKFFRHVAVAGFTLALAACMTTAPAQPINDVYVMRHLHTPKGVENPDLTELGQDYALKLRDWLAPNPPRTIFVSSTKRAMQTAAPTAKRYRLEPVVYDPSDTAALLALIPQQRGPVLIVGHSNTVPDIVAGLGGDRPAPLVHEDFGEVWHVQGNPPRTTRTKL